MDRLLIDAHHSEPRGVSPRSNLSGRSSAGLRRAALLMALVLLSSTGCGYSTKEIYPADVRSVAVPIFNNRSFYRGAERDLTEAIIKEIELRTPYKVANGPTADTQITGTILDVRQRQIARRRPGNVPEQIEVSIIVDWTWKNQRTGETIRTRQGFESVGRYRPTQPIGEPYEIAQHDAVQRMAADIVSTMRADW